jgi:hypothetical protein
MGHESISSDLFYSLVPRALILSVYRPKCLLGFVLGMSTSVGGILPTVFGMVMVLATVVVHRFIGLLLTPLTGYKDNRG